MPVVSPDDATGDEEVGDGLSNDARPMPEGYHDRVPDTRSHRSRAPEDGDLFDSDALGSLREATAHLCWLLDRGYAERSALQLVGDRFRLVRRQRDAVRRSACSTEELLSRHERLVAPADIAGQRVVIDGFNVLITVESALGGGVLLVARDGCVRDLANLRGTWRRVAETREAIELVGETLAGYAPSEVHWYLDQRVSNSGRLRGILDEVGVERGYPWQARLMTSVDAELKRSDGIVASADSGVLGGCGRWVNLARIVVDGLASRSFVVDLGAGVPLPSH
jgi:hypothetical protein